MNKEKKIVLHLCVIIFSIMFSNNLLYQLRNWFIVNQLTIEILPILSTFSFILMIPLAILYGYHTNNFPLEQVFRHFLSYFTITLFIIFFIVLPNYDTSLDFTQYESSYLKYPYIICAQWPFVVLYFLSDFWSSVLYTTSIWNMINTVFNSEKGKLYYNYFGIASNAGILFSGIFAFITLKIFIWIDIKYIEEPHQIGSIFAFIILILCSTAYYSSHKIETYNINNLRISHLQTKNTKTAMGLLQSIKHVFSSKYIAIIAILSISLGVISVNMEYILQPSIKSFFNYINIYAKNDPMSKIYHLQIILLYSSIGFFIAIIGNLLCSISLKKLGWSKTIMSIPIVTLFGSLIAILFKQYDYQYQNHALVIIIVIINAVRYSVADILPEMLYQPMDKENQSKGKASVKIAAKYGKFIGAASLSIITIVQNKINLYIALINIFITSIIIFLIIKFAKKYYNQLAREKALPFID